MNATKVPNGDEKVTIELTVKELMALTGVHFYANHEIRVSAKKKLNMVLGDVRGIEHAREATPYQMYN